MTKPQKIAVLVEEWLKRVHDDELNAASILRHRDGTPLAVCFLSQQIAGKCLKTLLLHCSGDYPRTHDLSQLLGLLSAHVPAILKKLKEDVLLLGPYYIATRYPADIPLEDFAWPMAVRAFEAAQRVQRYTQKKIKR